MFKGNTLDYKPVESQLEKLKKIFGVKELVFIGDRGMLKREQIDKIEENKWEYITAITKPQIEKLINDKVIDASLSDDKLCEIEYNSTRYIFKKIL